MIENFKTKTLSLRYHPYEDRVKLIINRNDVDPIAFWMTRRLYISTLFSLDNYLESMGIELNNEQEPELLNEQKLEQVNVISTEILDIYLLIQVKLRLGKKKERVFISFTDIDKKEYKTVMAIDGFLNFYKMMKRSFPTKEWGHIV